MTKTLIRAILLGLGIFKLVDVAKEISGLPLQPLTKTAAVGVATAGLAAVFNDGPRDAVLTGLGALGVATLAHQANRTLRNVGDDHQQVVIGRAGSVSRRT